MRYMSHEIVQDVILLVNEYMFIQNVFYPGIDCTICCNVVCDIGDYV